VEIVGARACRYSNQIAAPGKMPDHGDVAHSRKIVSIRSGVLDYLGSYVREQQGSTSSLHPRGKKQNGNCANKPTHAELPD
jgi:hypothetical protein